MKSKSPFAMKSPLNAYKNDQKGNYANPAYVKEEMVGVAIGKAMTKAGGDIFSGLTASDKTDSSGTIATHGLGGGEYKGFGGGMREINLPETPDVNTNLTDKGFGRYTGSEFPNLVRKGQEERNVNGRKILYHEANADKLGYKKDTQERADFIKASTADNLKIHKTDEPTREGKAENYITFEDGKRTLAINMNGSPVKHNAGAVGSIGNADPLAGGIAGIGQQISNQAQQRAAKLYTNRASNGPTTEAAGGMIGVTGSIGQDVLPPPNQVAETGSYGGGGDRILEMDSNPVGNQSIGRDTDVASQLFGSGQRASMLAMKGTPLHDAGHGEKQSHSHPSKTTTKMKPDGEYPGAKYVKGDLVDQDDLLDKTKLDAHIATQVQSDKKGTFIKEKSDDGPGSDIETSKGFGKKIRLGSMGRSSYTSNMKDQLDPNDFLFKKTPKK